MWKEKKKEKTKQTNKQILGFYHPEYVGNPRLHHLTVFGVTTKLKNLFSN